MPNWFPHGYFDSEDDAGPSPEFMGGPKDDDDDKGVAGSVAGSNQVSHPYDENEHFDYGCSRQQYLRYKRMLKRKQDQLKFQADMLSKHGFNPKGATEE